MVQYLDATFSALSSPARRSMLDQIAREHPSISRLAEVHEMSLRGALKNVELLEDAGLVTTSKDGRTRTCAIRALSLDAPIDWMSERRRRWSDLLDRFERDLERHHS